MKPLMLLVLFAALSSSVCRKSDVRKLDELPKDVAENLKHIPDSDVLVSIAPIAPPDPQPSPIFARACSVTQVFWVQVSYPVTVCTPFNLLPGTFMADAPPRSSGPQPKTIVKSYKLSALEGQPLATPFGCQTRSGPFFAQITKTIACNEATSCEMLILGVPSCPACPSFVWSGTACELDNRPTEVKFIGTPMGRGEPTFSPCNSRTTCGGSTSTPSPIP